MHIHSRGFRRRRGGPTWRFGLLLLASLALAPAGWAGKSDDALLQELEGEARKIGGGGTAAAPVGEKPADKGAAKAGSDEAFPKGLSQDDFAKALKDAYSGTHAFYMKLTPNVRDEIYGDYKNGAGIEQIRAKISERTMHR
jgi:hypothetical protein